MQRRVPSAVDADVWSGVLDELLHGVVHAANNRVAALGGILQLQDHGLATPSEGIAALRDEVARLRTLMERFRDLTTKRGEQREALRFSDALRASQLVLAHASATRNWQVTVADEGPDVEPVLLWPADPFRFATLLLLAAGAETKTGELFAAVLRNGDFTEVSVVAPGQREATEASLAYRALAEAAQREGGQLRCDATNHGASVELTLVLPGLSAASARG